MGVVRPPEVIRIPWNDMVVTLLNRFQDDDSHHGYTCGVHSTQKLVATRVGWICPLGSCTYRQHWAHASSINLVQWKELD